MNLGNKSFGRPPKARGAYDLSDDYERRFPEDPIGEETGINARVWRTYLAESAEFDANMVGEARDGLDAMLVFAGLFSAVVTSFLVQASEELQADFTQTNAYLLFELIAIQRAAAEGNPVSSVPVSPLDPTSTFIPDERAVWVNGLWAVSLSLGLVVALAAVLVKQWLHRYMKVRSGPPGERSYVRHYRFIGFEKWQVLGIIGALPVIMHVSLALFLLGLVIFFTPLHPVLSYAIGGITLAVYLLYLASHILPVLDPQCPYQTPLSDFILILKSKIRSLVSYSRKTLAYSLEQVMCSLQLSDEKSDSTSSDEGPALSEHSWSILDLEKLGVDRDRHSLSVEALHWLYNISSNNSVRSIVLQAIGGLPAAASQKLQKLFNYGDIKPVHEQLLFSCTVNGENSQIRQAIPHLHTAAERLCRLFIFFPNHGFPWLISFPSSKDKRFEATALAQGFAGGSSTVEDYRTFLSTHANLHQHPFVWVRIVQHAHQIGTFAGFEDSNKISPVFCRMLLPAIWGSNPSSYTPSSEKMPMHVALRLHLPKEICHYLLAMLSQFDSWGFSLNLRAIAAAMEFALHHVSSGSSDTKSAHWEIIEYVFRQSSGQPENLNDQEEWTNFMASFVIRLIKNTGICEHPLGREILLERRDYVLKVYWAAIMKQVYSKRGEMLEETESLLLRRATQGTLRELQMVPDRDHMSKTLTSNVNRVFDILSLALSAGSVEAFEIVEDLDCLELFAKFHQPSQSAAIIGSYVTGLKTFAQGPAREMYISHLYEPQNLRFAILSIFEWWPYIHPEDIEISDLIQLRPDDFVWDECRWWLKYVLEWVREDKALGLDTFNARRLGEESEWKVLRAYLTDSEELGVVTEENWSGILKLRGAIQALDSFFAEKEANTESLIIPPSPVRSCMSPTGGDSTLLSQRNPVSKFETEPGMPLSRQKTWPRWKSWILRRLPTLRDYDTPPEYV